MSFPIILHLFLQLNKCLYWSTMCVSGFPETFFRSGKISGGNLLRHIKFTPTFPVTRQALCGRNWLDVCKISVFTTIIRIREASSVAWRRNSGEFPSVREMTSRLVAACQNSSMLLRTVARRLGHVTEVRCRCKVVVTSWSRFWYSNRDEKSVPLNSSTTNIRYRFEI